MPGRGRPFPKKYETAEARVAAIKAAGRRYYERNRAKVISDSHERYHANPTRARRVTRAATLVRDYGITSEQYAEMLAKQKGVCAICHGPPTRGDRHFSVDHCHLTGRVRALLCSGCNTGIGMFLDDPELLRRAVAYLEEHSE